MAIRRINYAPSRKPYALDLDSFRVDEHGIARVRALWVGRKNQNTYVSEGHVWGSYATLDDLMANFDPRYGGTCVARWDGDSLWAPGFSMAQMQEAAARLAPVLDALPQVPAGYDGWYSLR